MDNYIYVLISGNIIKYAENREPLIDWTGSIGLKAYDIKKIYRVD